MFFLPKISVLMSAYNAEKYITGAMDSILEQTFRDFEFIIIDDYSTDSTWELIQKYAKDDFRIVPRRNVENLKLSKSLNKGIALARSSYIVRMDADDWAYADRLEKQYRFMETHPEIGLSGGGMEVCDENMRVVGIRKYYLEDDKIKSRIFRYSPFSHPTIIIRKSILDKAGLYNPYYNPAEDYELYFRIGQYTKFGNLEDIILKYRMVQQSMTTGSTRTMELMTVRIRKQYAQVHHCYKMTFNDRFYSLLHWLSIYTIPLKAKLWLFNLLRDD